MKYYCIKCQLGDIHPKRWSLGYRYCLECGEKTAKQRVFTVACANKQGYEFMTNKWIKELNPKRTT